MDTRSVIGALALLAGLALGQTKPQQELEVGKPAEIILPPPVLIDAKAQRKSLTVSFRELGSDRVLRYNLYIMADKEWELLGTTEHSPVELEGCTNKRAVYGLSAVDRSNTVGDKRIFRSRPACAKLKAPAPK
jgi:hypothetical protein